MQKPPLERHRFPVGLRSAPPAFQEVAHPEVTIVVPVRDHWNLTVQCLRAIAADQAQVPYEVVVVDDDSHDRTPRHLRRVAGIRTVRLEENRGFVGAVNAGVALARGRYVVLLNNDTRVRPGWLDALLRVVESDATVGVVGAKLVYPDGRLQEAGGIIWRDGSGHNFGRDQDPDDPPFNFVRDVDYCSGACLLVRADLLRAIGGLDVGFSPAYYEDTDLCFAARALGYRVVYQPACVVEHLEGASHGTDPAAGGKRHQVLNRERFRDKWAHVLEQHGDPEPGNPRLTAWRRPAGRALVIDHQVPMPDHDSGSRRMSELLFILNDLGFGVTFAPQRDVAPPRYVDALTTCGIEVLRGPQDLDAYLHAVGRGLRLVVLSRPTVAWSFLPMLRTLVPDATIIYDTVDLHFVREARRSQVEADRRAAQSADFHHQMEMTLARLTDHTWVVSDIERDVLRAHVPDVDVAVVPNVHRVGPLGPPFHERAGVLFVGHFAHGPNRDAAMWLATDILAHIRAAIPDVLLRIAGSDPPRELLALAGDAVTVLGWVPSLEPHYHASRVFIAPLRYGAGLKGKVGESLAHGLPVVTTAIGAEGMGLRDGHDVVIAEGPAGIAAAVAALYRDPIRWARLAARGRETIAHRYSPQTVREHMAAHLRDIGVLD